ncbi:hypothetical protein [Methylobacterium oxalidis]|uniref:Uncharacterized protein n=1 Tax=Methylobacterium oxalidis TaxID=944322 RepID=A0A512JCG6_9HYPH|nr:hypothetical protein [Methylobacterium oxalidis]GEP07654.1 hypothetical protein MOX02_56920 [Methylobacterium oxalidis]GLS66129.1 hypothetical protein GCM10007888_45110 [Methylobacterium oxalidis]
MKRLLLIIIGLCAVGGGLMFARSLSQPDGSTASLTSPATTSGSGEPAEASKQAEQATVAPAPPSFLQLSADTAALRAIADAQGIGAIGAPGRLTFAQAGPPDFQPDIPTGSIKPKGKHRR